jgi:integrase
MKGGRALTDDEVARVSQAFRGTYAARDRALFLLDVKTGYRISELLSLRVGDVRQHGGFVERVAIARKHMKGKHEGPSIPLHSEAKSALAAWLMEMNRQGDVSPDTYLFASRKGFNRPLRPGQASATASLRRVPSHGEIVEPHDEKNVWANRL